MSHSNPLFLSVRTMKKHALYKVVPVSKCVKTTLVNLLKTSRYFSSTLCLYISHIFSYKLNFLMSS